MRARTHGAPRTIRTGQCCRFRIPLASVSRHLEKTGAVSGFDGRTLSDSDPVAFGSPSRGLVGPRRRAFSVHRGVGRLTLRLCRALRARRSVLQQHAGSSPLLQHPAVADCPRLDRLDARTRSTGRTCAGVSSSLEPHDPWFRNRSSSYEPCLRTRSRRERSRGRSRGKSRRL
jgi:hypothetical protein